jgi:pantetheine-phosphate adenylyltransferase
VAIGINPAKKPMFTTEERIEMLANCCQSVISNGTSWKVEAFHNKFLVNYAAEIGANFIIRGIRNETDYEYERTMRYLNADRRPEIQSIFLMPPRHLVEVSSGAVKMMVGPDGWEDFVRPYVNDFVFERLKQHAKS